MPDVNLILGILNILNILLMRCLHPQPKGCGFENGAFDK